MNRVVISPEKELNSLI